MPKIRSQRTISLLHSNRKRGYIRLIECAASRGLLSPIQWARTRREVLGSTSYLMPKGKGNNSMSVKRKLGEKLYLRLV